MTIVEILSLMPPSAPLIIAIDAPVTIGYIKVFRVLDEVVLTLKAKRDSLTRDAEMKREIIGAAKAYVRLAEKKLDRADRKTIYPPTRTP